MSNERALLTREEAAEYLGVSVRFLENRARDRQPPDYHRLGSRTVRYDRGDLDKFLAETKRTQSAGEALTADDAGSV